MAVTATKIETAQPGKGTAGGSGAGAYLTDEQILGIEGIDGIDGIDSINDGAGGAGPGAATGAATGEAEHEARYWRDTGDDWGDPEELSRSAVNAVNSKNTDTTERKEGAKREEDTKNDKARDGEHRTQTKDETQGKDGSRDKDGPLSERVAQAATVPREFEAIFATGESGAKLRDIYRRESEYRELFPDVSEARALRGAFATIDDARAAVQARHDLQHVDELFDSSSPAAHVELMAELAQRDPAAFRSLAATFGERLGEIDPQAYRVISGEFARTALEAGHVPQQIELLARAAEKGDAAAVKFLVGELLERIAALKKDGTSHLSPAQSSHAQSSFAQSSPAQRPLASSSAPAQSGSMAAAAVGAAPASREADASPQSTRFVESVNADVERSVEQAVGGRVNELLPDAPEGTRQKIAGEIYRELDAAMKKDPGLLAQVSANLSAAQKAGQFGQRERSAMAALVMSKAKSLLPAVARRVVGEWTAAMVASSQTRRTRQSTSASRADVGVGGAPRAVSTRPGKVDYAKLSDEEILEG